ncbi:terminase small subunit [Hafnia phage Enc34]|uniref:Terminase small subunit n=1 Tax=Hafnia phage Enc34 TaxID=1150990 RepID=H6WYG6_9CAUD|nr:terminase small subunit [Hafnia phage Enc34]AFB84024.1 terminase small subunit [Hafnia phage Enc34]
MTKKIDAPIAAGRRRSNAPDADTEAMIFQGCNITQIAKLFRMERRDITPKIMDVPPIGERGGYPIYAVHEVAPYLVKPLYDVETYLRRMNFKDLPKELSKEFWAGQRAKQDFDIKAGNLWETEDIISHFGEAVKILRMSLLLIPDTLARQAGLTEAQRSATQSAIDGILNDLTDALVDRFKEDKEADDDEV